MTAPLQLKDFLGRIFQDSKNLAMKSGDENGQVTNEVCCIAKILEAAGYFPCLYVLQLFLKRHGPPVLCG